MKRRARVYWTLVVAAALTQIDEPLFGTMLTTQVANAIGFAAFAWVLAAIYAAVTPPDDDSGA